MAAGKFAKLLPKPPPVGGAKWGKAERERLLRQLPLLGLADVRRLREAAGLIASRTEQQVADFAHGWLRYTLALHSGDADGGEPRRDQAPLCPLKQRRSTQCVRVV